VTVASDLEKTTFSAAPPYVSEVAHEGRLVARPKCLPGAPDLIHAAAVQVGTDGAFELVEKGVDLFVRLSPSELAMRVSNVSVQRLSIE
jgi:hypothetical protein